MTGRPLSPMQRQTIAMLAKGEPVKRIATALGISHRTVHRHLDDAYRKLGVQNRIEATREAYRLGIAPCPCGRCCGTD